MLPLELYLDESGHASRHPFVAVAGFMGTAEAWSDFAAKWNAILVSHGVIPPFHMTDFEAKKAQFHGWDEARRRALLAPLMREITTRPLCMVGAALSVETFHALDWSMYADYQPIENPYHWAIQDALRQAVKASDDPDLPECRGERICAVLAAQPEFQGAADGYYRATAFHERKLAERATFGEPGELAQLQAADIAAFELRWKITRPDLNRFPWCEIVKAGRTVLSVRGIDPSVFLPSCEGPEYDMTVSRQRRPIDVMLKMTDTKARRNQGKHSRKGQT